MKSRVATTIEKARRVTQPPALPALATLKALHPDVTRALFAAQLLLKRRGERVRAEDNRDRQMETARSYEHAQKTLDAAEFNEHRASCILNEALARAFGFRQHEAQDQDTILKEIASCL